jgi:hypothetical protein
MGTQKTKLGGGGPVRPGGEEDLNIPEGPEYETAAPQPPKEKPPTENIYGRELLRVDRQHMIDTHNADEAAAAAAEEGNVRQQAEGLMPEELRRAAQEAPKRPPTPTPQTEEESQRRRVVPPDDEMVRAIQLLTDTADQAERDGDPAAAARMKNIAEQLLSGSDVRRKAKEYKRHPILDKLINSFGLKKIKREDVSWSGFKWTFAPIPAPLRWWMGEKIDQTTFRNAPALHIATSLLALDGEPLWKVFSIPLAIDYEVMANEDRPVETGFEIKPFRKFCECSAEVDMEAEGCEVCGASLNPLDVPLKLRKRYSEVVYEWLMNDFGPLDRLIDLVELRDAQMKDPLSDEEEVYPLVSRSSVPSEMASSPPGDG